MEEEKNTKNLKPDTSTPSDTAMPIKGDSPRNTHATLTLTLGDGTTIKAPLSALGLAAIASAGDGDIARGFLDFCNGKLEKPERYKVNKGYMPVPIGDAERCLVMKLGLYTGRLLGDKEKRGDADVFLPVSWIDRIVKLGEALTMGRAEVTPHDKGYNGTARTIVTLADVLRDLEV